MRYVIQAALAFNGGLIGIFLTNAIIGNIMWCISLPVIVVTTINIMIIFYEENR